MRLPAVALGAGVSVGLRFRRPGGRPGALGFALRVGAGLPPRRSVPLWVAAAALLAGFCAVLFVQVSDLAVPAGLLCTVGYTKLTLNAIAVLFNLNIGIFRALTRKLSTAQTGPQEAYSRL